MISPRINIWTEFKNELGQANVAAQFTELALRTYLQCNPQAISGEALTQKAKEYGLSISVIPEDIASKISGSYIVQVHLCVAHFLDRFAKLPGSPTFQSIYDPNQDENKLKWTLYKAFGHIPNEMMQQYAICDYYRLVRNAIVHPKDNQNSLQGARKRINSNEERLHAPNELNELSFDDQVLFSRAARSIFEYLFQHSSYNQEQIREAYERELSDITRGVYGAEKKEKKIRTFLQQQYPSSAILDIRSS